MEARRQAYQDRVEMQKKVAQRKKEQEEAELREAQER